MRNRRRVRSKMARKTARGRRVSRDPRTTGGASATPDARSPLAALLTAQRQLGNATVSRLIQRSLAGGFSNFNDSCSCGEDLGNNCAHYLSDALIRSGDSDLDAGEGGLYRKHAGRAVCKHGRPVRARELEKWFADKASERKEGEPQSDQRHWAVWQGGGGYWGGHVVIHKHNGAGGDYDSRGTGDYPEWPKQKHYTW